MSRTASKRKASSRKSKTQHAPEQGKCLVLGGDHPNHPFGKYVVCLTDNQKKVLFRGRRPKVIGCGTFACAFVGPTKSTVVKLTRDPEDVAALMAAQKTKHVPKIKSVFELSQPGYALRDSKDNKETPVYAMVVERLKTFSHEEEMRLNRAFRKAHKTFEEVGLFPTEREDVAALIDFIGVRGDDAKIVEDAFNISVDLQKKGIMWTDVHAGNIAYDTRGRLKALDLGISQTQLTQRPTILAGALAAATQRVRRYVRRKS